MKHSAHKSWHSRTLNKWSGFFPVQIHLFIIISSSSSSSSSSIINIDFSISLLSCHSAHWNFIHFSCLQERKNWLKNTRKARFSSDSNELRLFKVSRLFIYLFIYLYILLYFLLLTSNSRLSKESSIWSLPC